MHFLGKENKRADFPKIFYKFPKIRDEAELNRKREDCRKKNFVGATHLIICNYIYNMNKLWDDRKIEILPF